jgi:hypothetical protein
MAGHLRRRVISAGVDLLLGGERCELAQRRLECGEDVIQPALDRVDATCLAQEVLRLTSWPLAERAVLRS